MRMNRSEEIKSQTFTLFLKKGYEGTSIRDITNSLHITSAAFYKHYESKEALFMQLFEESQLQYNDYVSRALSGKQSDSTEAKLKAVFEAFCMFKMENIERSNFVMRYSEYPPVELQEAVMAKVDRWNKNLKGSFCNIIDEGIEKNLFIELSGEELLRLFFIQTKSLISYSYIDHELIDNIWSMFWKSITK